MTKTLPNKFDHENIILADDFNFYVNRKLDMLGSMTNKHDNNIYHIEMESMFECLSLNDVCRTLNTTLGMQEGNHPDLIVSA